MGGAGHSGVGTERCCVLSSFLLFISQRFVQPVATCQVTSQRFFFAVRWLMSLERWQPIKCYNRTVFPCVPHPPQPVRLTVQKEKEWSRWGEGHKTGGEGNSCGWIWEVRQTDRQTKAQNKTEKKPPNAVETPPYPYVYLSEHKLANDMSLKIPQTAKLSIYHEIFDEKEICSNSAVILIDTKITLKCNNHHILFLFFFFSHMPNRLFFLFCIDQSLQNYSVHNTVVLGQTRGKGGALPSEFGLQWPICTLTTSVLISMGRNSRSKHCASLFTHALQYPHFIIFKDF